MMCFFASVHITNMINMFPKVPEDKQNRIYCNHVHYVIIVALRVECLFFSIVPPLKTSTVLPSHLRVSFKFPSVIVPFIFTRKAESVVEMVVGFMGNVSKAAHCEVNFKVFGKCYCENLSSSVKILWV